MNVHCVKGLRVSTVAGTRRRLTCYRCRPSHHPRLQSREVKLRWCHTKAPIQLNLVRLTGRNIALRLAKAGKGWKAAAAVRMPEARGDIREIIGQPVFVPLQKLAMIYGKASLSFPRHAL